MQFGLCTISNRDATAETVLEHAAAAGYHGVEIWGGDHVGETLADCRRVGEAAAERDLSVPVYGSYLRAGTDAFADELDRELNRTAALDADLIRVWAGEQEYEDCNAEHWERVCADLRELAAAAADRDISVTVEKHEGTVTNTSVGARELIASVDEPNCRLNWQPLFGLPAAAILDEVAELVPISNNVHLQAVRERGGQDRCALADAYFDMGAVVERLREAGFDGFANVEFVTDTKPYGEAVTDDLAFLRAT